jgi:hypothetical protein
MNKVLLWFLQALAAGAVMVGVYYNVTFAVVITWAGFSIVAIAWAAAHAFLESDSDIRLQVARLKKAYTLRKRLLSLVYLVAWWILLVIVERYNLALLAVLAFILVETLVLRYKPKPKEDTNND